jgi:two-component system chemotaxis response regulator CheB
MALQNLIVVGASNGGLEAFSYIAACLPADLPAAVALVVHVDAASPPLLATLVDRAGPLRARTAKDGEPLQAGRIYVAPPDVHLLVDDGALRLSRTARENRTRPAVDPLFRTAARAYGASVVGVVLTGSLDDGTAGLLAIKARGGIAVVQDPADAMFPGMPESALRNVDVDHCLPLREIPELLVRLAARGAAEDPPAVEEADGPADPIQASGLTCPTCHGALWEQPGSNFLFYECRTGHTFGARSLLAAQSDDLETALWGAVRALEESASIERRIAARMAGAIGRRHGESATAKEDQARLIRRIVLGSAADAVLDTEDVEVQCGGRRAVRPSGPREASEPDRGR